MAGTVDFAGVEGDALESTVDVVSAEFSPGGGELGPELVINGDFASATGWTLTGGASIGGGELAMDGSGVGRATRAAADTISAATYRYSFDLLTTSGDAAVRVVVGGSLVIVSGSDSPGTFEGDVVSAASDQNLRLQLADTTATFDNFSVKQVL